MKREEYWIERLCTHGFFPPCNLRSHSNVFMSISLTDHQKVNTPFKSSITRFLNQNGCPWADPPPSYITRVLLLESDFLLLFFFRSWSRAIHLRWRLGHVWSIIQDHHHLRIPSLQSRGVQRWYSSPLIAVNKFHVVSATQYRVHYEGINILNPEVTSLSQRIQHQQTQEILIPQGFPYGGSITSF